MAYEPVSRPGNDRLPGAGLAAGLSVSLILGLTGPALGDPGDCNGPRRCAATAMPPATEAPAEPVSFEVGDRFEQEDYVVLRDYQRNHLTPQPHGHDYVRVGEAVLLIDSETRRIIQRIGIRAGR